MLTLIDAMVAVCTVVIVWYLVRAHLRRIQNNSLTDAAIMEDYLQKITLVTGFSVYDTFCKSAEGWRVSADRIDKDFRIYLASQSLPFYVKDFVRKSQKHIDELYMAKGNYLTDKRVLLFYSFLFLLFWGGAVFLSLYVFPNILPEDIRAMQVVGPP
jgi:hypothetical protein